MLNNTPSWLHNIKPDDVEDLLRSEKSVVREFARWMSEPDKVLALQAEVTRLSQENLRLRTVMLAAHDEIAERWESHRDAEGYRPHDLMLQLKSGTGYYPGLIEKILNKRDDGTGY